MRFFEPSPDLILHVSVLVIVGARSSLILARAVRH